MAKTIFKTAILASLFSLSACMSPEPADPTLIPKAQAGDPESQAMLIKFYSQIEDVKGMVKWSLPLSKTNSKYAPMAQGVLARAYFSGEGGLPKDLVKTCDYAMQAAKRGAALGQFFLADCYYNGYGNVPKSLQEAFKWNLKAASSQSEDLVPKLKAMAQSNVGELYLKGEGVKQDKAQARIWLQKAANYAELYKDSRIGDYVNDLMKQL